MTRRHGIYLDDRASRVIAPGYLAELRDLGLDHVVLVAQATDGRWLWSADQAARAHAECDRLGLDVSIMSWPTMGSMSPVGPTVEFERLRALRPRRWEVDLEGQWRGRLKDRRAAAAVLVAAASELGIPLDLTTHAASLESREASDSLHDLLGAESELWMQAYPRATLAPREPLFTIAGALKRAMDRLSDLRGDASEGLILAAWDQRWPMCSPQEGMSEAYRLASGYPVRWWSSKFVARHGARRNPYAAEGIRRCIAGA